MSTPDSPNDSADSQNPAEPEAAEAQAAEPIAGEYPPEVRIVEHGGRRFVLVGTAHVSQSSVELVREVIEQEKPDRVCVELDPQRYEAISKKKQWEELDLKQVIRKKQLTTLLVSLVLSAYQKRIGAQLGVTPGTELLEATKVAQELDIPFDLCDRDVRVTLRRAARRLGFFRKIMLMSELIVSIFDNTEMTEEQIQELKQQDVLNELMNELGRVMPPIKEVLIDERDGYLAQKIKDSEGERVVAVIGIGHQQGIEALLQKDEPIDLEEISEVPAVSSAWKAVGWAIPIAILSAIGYIGYTKGASAAGENLLFWILANGIPSSIGAVIALAHPLTILAAFLCSPITSLTPVIGAGYVTAFVQTWKVPPVVKEFQTVTEDIVSPKMWWKNKLLRIFLAFLLPTLGSIVGTWVGGVEIFTNLF